MLNAIRKFFKFEELGTNFQTEIIAGVTTFATMSYILIVNPKILAVAGMPFGATLTATILAAFIACMLMGLYAKRPFGLAPYMGENAFIAYTVVLLLGFTWQQALGAIFLSGILFFILTLLSVRPYLVNSIPTSLKLSFTVGLGLFLIFVGLMNTKIIETAHGTPVKIGNLQDPQVLLALLGLVVMIVLTVKKVKAPILIGILAITFIGLAIGDITLPSHIICAPPSITPILGKLDILGILNFKAIPLIFILVVLIFVDTMGTLIGVSYRGGFLDKKGNLPEIHKPMYVDAFSTSLAAILGTTTTGVYAESATGIESGGKSGLVAIVVGILF
jgi:AGZA family xanthine/uracil permease-like MFS transporter